jgi:hypothetical protein
MFQMRRPLQSCMHVHARRMSFSIMMESLDKNHNQRPSSENAGAKWLNRLEVTSNRWPSAKQNSTNA